MGKIYTKDGTEYDIDQIVTGKGAKFKIVKVTFGPFYWYLVWQRGWFFDLGWDNIDNGKCYLKIDDALERYHQCVKAGKS